MLIVPDGDEPEGEEKINLKNLYEMFRYTSSHGLVSIQFLGVLGILFSVWVSETRNAITELYKNLSYATLSGANDSNFDSVSEFVSRLNFSIKKHSLESRNKREKENLKKEKEIINKTIFVELPHPFEQEIVNDMFKDLEHKKIKHPYVELQVKDAQTIEMKTQATNNEFF